MSRRSRVSVSPGSGRETGRRAAPLVLGGAAASQGRDRAAERASRRAGQAGPRRLVAGRRPQCAELFSSLLLYRPYSLH